MERIAVEDVDAAALGDSEVERRGLSDPLGTTDVAINHYRLAPGEAFSGGLHAHLDQEELFFVVDGTATFEIKPEPTADSDTVQVGAGEAIRFAPGEYQQGRNESDDPLVAVALGAPRGSREVRVPHACRDCGESEVLAFVPTEEGGRLRCPECGIEFDAEV